MDERENIRQIIERAYIEGIHIEQDSAKVQAGFHPEFRMLVRKGSEITKVDPEAFRQMLATRRENDPAAFEQPLTFEIPMIDVELTAATARIELYRGGKHLFTDFMLLYKFDDGWRIVSKAFVAQP